MPFIGTMLCLPNWFATLNLFLFYGIHTVFPTDLINLKAHKPFLILALQVSYSVALLCYL